MNKNVLIIYYGHGNANSIKNALAQLGVVSKYSSDPADIVSAEALILPGVGHHGSAMLSLKDRDLVRPLNNAVLVIGTPVLGICLGMQLMSSFSEEGGAEGLGWVSARTELIVPGDRTRFKVPHIGWNTITANPASLLFRGIDTSNESFYFCHSFAMQEVAAPAIASAVHYGQSYVGAFEKDNIFGVQFHPEKSQECGLRLLSNFLLYTR